MEELNKRQQREIAEKVAIATTTRDNTHSKSDSCRAELATETMRIASILSV